MRYFQVLAKLATLAVSLLKDVPHCLPTKVMDTAMAAFQHAWVGLTKLVQHVQDHVLVITKVCMRNCFRT